MIRYVVMFNEGTTGFETNSDGYSSFTSDLTLDDIQELSDAAEIPIVIDGDDL